MAAYTTTIKDEQVQAAYKRNANPSYRALQMDLKYALFGYTFAGTEATTEVITLGSLGVAGAVVIPELSRIRDTGGAQDIDVSMKLNALVGGSTSTDLTGTVALDNASIPFTEVAGAALVTLGASDDLRLIVDDAGIGAVTEGETIVVEIAYYSPNL